MLTIERITMLALAAFVAAAVPHDISSSRFLGGQVVVGLFFAFAGFLIVAIAPGRAQALLGCVALGAGMVALAVTFTHSIRLELQRLYGSVAIAMWSIVAYEWIRLINKRRYLKIDSFDED